MWPNALTFRPPPGVFKTPAAEIRKQFDSLNNYKYSGLIITLKIHYIIMVITLETQSTKPFVIK